MCLCAAACSDFNYDAVLSKSDIYVFLSGMCNINS